MSNPFAAIYDPELDVGSRLERALIAVGSERKRQLALQAAGRFSYTPSDHALTDAQRLAMLTEELGEVARNVLRRDRLVTGWRPVRRRPPQGARPGRRDRARMDGAAMTDEPQRTRERVATDETYATTTDDIRHLPDGRLVVRMVSGRLVDLVDPDPATILVEDLAYALARVCRFTGNVTRWWSVADHALLCRELVCEAGASELASAALHHDSHEAIVGDIITPVRELLGPDRVHALTRRLDEAIGAALGLDVELLWHPLVTEVDRGAAHLEAQALQGGTAHLLCPAPNLRFAPRALRSDGRALAARRFVATDGRLRQQAQPETARVRT